MPVSKLKKHGFGLDVRTFDGIDGRKYLVFRTPAGAYHAFVEVFTLKRNECSGWTGIRT